MIFCFVYSICLKLCPRFGHGFTFLVYVRILIQKMKSKVWQTGVMNPPDVQSRLFTKSASFSNIFVKVWLEYQILSSNATKLYCSESIIAFVLCKLIEFWSAGDWFFERKLMLRQYSHEFWFWSDPDKRIAMSRRCSIHNWCRKPIVQSLGEWFLSWRIPRAAGVSLSPLCRKFNHINRRRIDLLNLPDRLLLFHCQ
jgi:hypothetical protein